MVQRVVWKSKQKWIWEPEAEIQGEAVAIYAGCVWVQERPWVTASALGEGAGTVPGLAAPLRWRQETDGRAENRVTVGL